MGLWRENLMPMLEKIIPLWIMGTVGFWLEIIIDIRLSTARLEDPDILAGQFWERSGHDWIYDLYRQLQFNTCSQKSPLV